VKDFSLRHNLAKNSQIQRLQELSRKFRNN
jgi:hypothetical protein